MEDPPGRVNHDERQFNSPATIGQELVKMWIFSCNNM